MSKTYFFIVFFCAPALLFSQNIFAQSQKDSTNNKALFAGVEDKFNDEMGPQSHLYNGVNYEFYDPTIKGNAYFLDNMNWNNGTIVYDGFAYKNVPLLYDVYADQVITLAYRSALRLQLIKDHVQSFDLLGHHIIYHQQDASNPTSPKTGFYDELYGGKVQVLAKRTKSLQHTNGFNGTIDSYFSPSLDYYLYKDGTYYPVSSQGSFLKVFKDKKNAVLLYMKLNNLKFKKQQKEEAMAKAAAYYDQLTN
jgi:hypothetical protein